MTFKVEAEYTDTFGGEPNYCWVERKILSFPENLSDLAIMRRLKAAFGLSSLRGKSYSQGDTWEFRPVGSGTILMARVLY